MSPRKTNRLLTADEVSEILGLGDRQAVYRLRREGHLKAVFGAPLSRATLERHLKKILAAAGIAEHLRQYDLRHSFVTLSLVAGVDIKTVSQEAGHASVAFTLDHYAHVLKTMQESASDKREALLAG